MCPRRSRVFFFIKALILCRSNRQAWRSFPCRVLVFLLMLTTAVPCHPSPCLTSSYIRCTATAWGGPLRDRRVRPGQGTVREGSQHRRGALVSGKACGGVFTHTFRLYVYHHILALPPSLPEPRRGENERGLRCPPSTPPPPLSPRRKRGRLLL